MSVVAGQRSRAEMLRFGNASTDFAMVLYDLDGVPGTDDIDNSKQRDFLSGQVGHRGTSNNDKH